MRIISRAICARCCCKTVRRSASPAEMARSALVGTSPLSPARVPLRPGSLRSGPAHRRFGG
eukprot:13591026-Alexandrium_andersonii.AAC.1